MDLHGCKYNSVFEKLYLLTVLHVLSVRTKRKPLLLHHSLEMSGPFTLTWVYSLIQQIEVGFSCVHI